MSRHNQEGKSIYWLTQEGENALAEAENRAPDIVTDDGHFIKDSE